MPKLRPAVLICSAVFLSLCLVINPYVSASAGEETFGGYVQTECLRVSPVDFVGAVRTAMDAIRKAASLLTKFDKKLGDFRMATAILDCMDLLDFASDKLSWSILASQGSNGQSGKGNGTGDVASDLRTWISAALFHQDTCLDGFEGTSGILKKIVRNSLVQVGPMVQNLLTMVHARSTPRPKNTHVHTSRPIKAQDSPSQPSHRGFNRFPSWVRPGDRRLLQMVDGAAPAADVVVAADGTGNFTTVMEAVKAAPENSEKRYVIYVKKGVYVENVEIKKQKSNIMMFGDGIDVTVISGNRSVADGWTTFRSATFAVSGRQFIARDMTFQNTAGPEKHQAVALRSDSDLAVFYRCAIRGYQDTLYAHTMRQFFRECTITGTVDFIFGDATAVFQNCTILAKQGLTNQKNSITAQGRKDPNEPTGFVIQFSNVSGDSDLNTNATATYLGRPWRMYSRTVFMQSYISDAVRPQGWLEWNGSIALDTLYYAEYMNYGPGSQVDQRVKWIGYHLLNSSAEADNFTVAQFIEGNVWLPGTGISYAAGLGSQ